MEFNRWWEGLPDEIYWLEVTDRKDLGIDLNAPQLRDDGKEYYGYSLILAVNEGDIVFHYHKDHKSIVAWSKVAGSVWPDVVVWGAHGTVARSAGVRPYVRPGWRLGLAGSEPLVPVITLDELRGKQDQIQTIREELESKHGASIYFPFELSERRDLRPTQSYLTKLPLDIVRLVPGLGSAVRHVTQVSQSNQLAEQRATYGFGAPYRPADEELAISERDPFAIDPALVERANHGHAITQNALAEYLRQRGIEPKSPKPTEPNYDIAWMQDSITYVAEVKSLTPENEEKQLRLGLGQLLHYRHILSQTGMQVRAVLVTESEPLDTTWSVLCGELRIPLVWPATFEKIWH